MLPEDGFLESCCLLVCYRPLASFWPANLNGSACGTLDGALAEVHVRQAYSCSAQR